MKRFLLAVLVCCSAGSALADNDNPPVDCVYSLPADPSTHIKLNGNKLILTQGAEVKEYTVAIEKIFGHLTQAAIEGPEIGAQVHYFTEREFGGQKYLFYDAVAFEQTCEAAD